MAETQRTSGQAGQNSSRDSSQAGTIRNDSQAPLSFYRNLELSLPRLICHFLAQEKATAAGIMRKVTAVEIMKRVIPAQAAVGAAAAGDAAHSRR